MINVTWTQVFTEEVSKEKIFSLWAQIIYVNDL